MSNQQELKSRPSFQSVLSAQCGGCFVSFGKVVPRRIEEGLEILLCSRCFICVHKCCYDFEASLTVQTDRISEFLCERCQGPPLPSEKDRCLVCYGTEGAMKRIGDELVHVYCALMHNDIEAVSYYPTLTFRKSPYYEDTPHSCQLCKKKNAYEQCAEESCRRKVHVYCAKSNYVAMAKQSDDQPRTWDHRIIPVNHGNFDLSDEIIPYELFSEEVDAALRDIEQLGLDLSFMDEIKKRVHRSYLEQTRSRRKSTKKLRRGGFSFVVCPQHESPSYCSCYGKADGDEMVLCECCFEWYHQKCIKIPPSDDSYICERCRSFYDFKRKAIDELRGGRNDYDISKLQFPLRTSSMDCLWVLRVADHRIRAGQSGKMMRELNKFPLKSSCMDLLIRQHNRPKIGALVEECLKGMVESEMLRVAWRPKRVLACDPEGRAMVCHQNVQFNRILRRGVQLLLSVVGGSKEGGFFPPLLRELEFKERALSDSYEQIIELSRLQETYQELQVLRQKAQAYNFVGIVQKIKNNTHVGYQEVEAALERANSTPNLPAYLAATLRNKFEVVSPIMTKIQTAILTAPDNTYVLAQLVEQLQAEHVLPPQKYLQLTVEKRLVQGLFLYLAKQEGGRIQEELTVAQQLEQLTQGPSLRPSQELLDILAEYSNFANGKQISFVWPALGPLLEKYQGVAVDFQIRQLAKRKFSKQERFLSVVDRAASVDHALLSEQSRGILQVWGVIKASFDHLMGMSLEETAEYEPLAEGVRLATSFMESIENFAIRLEEEGGKALLQQAKTRREELQQLRTLYTEAHLQKNPLTLPKILSSLPKNNPLVKQWHSLKKQLSGLQGKFTTLLARINQRIEYFKTEKKLQRKQQIRDNNEKPTLAQANELLQALKHSSVQMGKQVRELTRIINNSLEIAAKVRRYIEERGDCNNSSLEELAQRRKEIDQQRKRVLINAELSLRGELIELYHLEICNRMRTSLLSPGLQLEKIGTQLKFAEEEGLMHTPTYCALKEKFENKNQKSKEVAQLKGLQQGLANQASKDSSFNFAALAQYRSRQALPDLPQIKTKNTYLDQLADRSRAIRQRASQALMPSPKWELGEARAVYLQALKSPYIQPDVSRLGSEINKAWEVVRRCRELGRSLSHLHPIFVQYEGLAFTVEQIQVVRREVRNNEEELTRLQRFVNSFDEKHRDQLQEIIQRIQTSGAVRETQLCRQAQLKYIRFWTKLLQCCKIAKRQIPFEKIRRLALDAYNLLQRCLRSGEDYQDLKTSIYELEDYLIMSKNHLKCYPCRTTTNLIADTFIDMDEFYLQHDDEEADLADAVPLLRPFSDLPKFRVKNLQRLEWRRQDLGLKRSRDKLDELPPERPSLREVERSSPEPAPVGVSESQRRKIKEIFLKNIRKNPELRRYGQCENQVKMIENQIFGEWHKDIVKYFEMSEQFQRLFMKLVHCPNISNKLIKKKFEFKFIQILVANLHKIDELEAIILTKLKEMDAEKTITRVAQPLPDATAPSQPAQEALIDSIAQGKVPEGFKQDLKKEMKLLKEGKHRKKNKHHKHRSRSRSPDAKFSSESQKELPSYIQNEYNKDESRPNPKPDLQQTHQMLTESPLRYDPQQEEMQTRQATFPRGSILRVKACDLQTSTKRRGKVELGVQVLTEQQHRKVVGELFDPGFTRLPIKKDKNQGEIIQYIAKSKKKYKYLVCWFEALRSEDNEVLKEIAVQANEKRKIFGWQNEHIKIHIMSMRQLVMVGRFVPPARVSSLSAAQHMAQERLVMVVQYPEKVYEVRDLYKPFESIERKQEEYPTTVPAPVIEQPPAYDFYPKYTMPTIEPLVKPQPVFDEQKTVYEGWGETVPQQPLPVPMPQLPQQLPPQQLPPPMPTSNLPYKVNQIRLHFGFSSFSPILTDEDEEGNNNGDLASDLLNSLGDFKMPAQPQSAPRDKPPQPPPPQQQYQGYYGYGYQSQPQTQQRPVPADNRWADYRGITQQTQGMPQQQVYNPLNPMAGKYPPMPAQMGQMGQGQMGQQMGQGQMGQYKNPMMERQRQNQPQMGQYYRGPSSANEGYDRRYQGGYQQ